MSFVRIWVHAVWATKKREPYLEDKKVRYAMFDHIRENCRKKGIYLDQINGWVEHCHATISLAADASIGKTMQLIKGESSHWINNTAKLLPNKFEWCNDYYAVSVSESALADVQKYVSNQEEHHGSHSFEDECKKFIERYGFTQMLGNEDERGIVVAG